MPKRYIKSNYPSDKSCQDAQKVLESTKINYSWLKVYDESENVTLNVVMVEDGSESRESEANL